MFECRTGIGEKWISKIEIEFLEFRFKYEVGGNENDYNVRF